ncbi:MAG: EAL domain-containing protein, partial [Ectothiorhodospiraceae bacterium]|jgi:diguanylate cyclase (GGDEF)-like protein/PAS domain S-box-containing protein
VDYGGLRLAWVGVPDSEGWVRPVAALGAACGYLHELRISVDDSRPQGQGPTGVALRKGRSVIRNVLDTESTMSPWHAAADKAGLKASAAIPIRRGGEVIATLNVYADEHHYFSVDLMRLLHELAMDASFALDRFDEETERRRMIEIIEATPDFVGVADREGRVLYQNPAACALVGEERSARNVRDCHTAESQGQLDEALGVARDRGLWTGESELIDAEGNAIPHSQVIIGHRDRSGEVTHYSTIARNIKSEKAAEAQIRHLAYTDALTGLANRTHLLERLEQDYSRALRHGRIGALLYIDVDGFKAFNDSMGHATGDAVLRALARRFAARQRKEDTLARIGGDEFVLLLDELGESSDEAAYQARRIADDIMDSLKAPFELEDQRLHLSASIGIALFPTGEADQEGLLQRADTAMFAAKEAGRGSVRFFDPSMLERVRRRLELEQELSKALAAGDFFLCFQPIVRLKDGAIIGVEALSRWRHPKHGLISPAEFIPVAEQTGQIVELGERVMESSLAALRLWLDAGVAGPDLRLSVNVSPLQCSQSDFAERLLGQLQRHGVPGSRLNLEITEGVVVRNMERAVEKIRQLQEQGVSVTLDDFGTGYSSLAYLTRLPLQALKIDRSFVQDVAVDPGAAAIVESILAISSHLHLRVVAEGVETREQAERLAQWGCSSAQGFHFGRPVPLAEMGRLLRQGPG